MKFPSPTPTPFVTTLKRVIEKFEPNMPCDFDTSILAQLRSLKEDSRIACQAGSLTATLNLPKDCARALCQEFGVNSQGAIVFAQAILEAGGMSTDLVACVLRVVYSVPKPLPSLLATDFGVFVTLYQTPPMVHDKNISVCKALNACLVSLRDNIWNLQGRLMVLCLSKDHHIFLSKLVPGDGFADDSTRNALMLKLRQVPNLKVIHSVPHDDISVAVADNGVNIILLACFNREVHLNSMENICSSFEALGIPNKEIFRLMVS